MPEDSIQVSHGLELRLSAQGACAIVELHNSGPDPLSVLSHIDAGERHYDPFTIELAGEAETRILRFYDSRNESSPIIVDLGPGQSLTHVLDLAAWAKRNANGSRPVAPGTYRMTAIYAVSKPSRVWHGTLKSPMVSIAIP